MNEEKLMRIVCEEMGKIADKGLTAGNLDAAYKLVDMYKDLKMCEDGGYSNGYDGDSSYGRHYVRGHYSRDGYSREGYSNGGNKYAGEWTMYSRGGGLSDMVRDFTSQLEDMERNATPEERPEINRFIQKIKSM